MTAPDVRQAWRDASAAFDQTLGPCDAPTQAWIDNWDRRDAEHKKRVADACAGRPSLLVGTADIERGGR